MSNIYAPVNNTSLTYGDLFQRVGGINVADHANWLLEFARRPLEQLSDQQIGELFETLPIIGIWTSEEAQRLFNEPFPPINWLAPYRNKIPQFYPDPRAVLSTDFHKPVQNMVHGLLGKAEVCEVEIRINVPFLIQRGAKKLRLLTDPMHPSETFMFKVASVLQAVADRLARCPNHKCEKEFFIKRRRDQMYCSDTCCSRVGMEKFRKRKHKGKAESNKKSGHVASTKGRKAHGTKGR